jgi:hypothetical protein
MMATMKGTIFWDVMPCNLAEFYQHIRENYSLHIQGTKASQVSTQKAAFALLDWLTF